jgi:hypothetical protein
MMPSPVKLPTVPLNHHCRTVDQIGHDLAQPLRTDRRGDVHRLQNIGEQRTVFVNSESHLAKNTLLLTLLRINA